MKKIFFIADAHLDRRYPERKKLMFSFLNRVIAHRGDLYILGDFFDFWANNRLVLKNNFDILEKIQKITEQDSKVGMLIGNRDMLLNQKVLSPFGIDFLGEDTEIMVDGKKVYLTHGHSLCAYDRRFQRYKKRFWPLFRLLDTILPGSVENYLARKFILRSKQVIHEQKPYVFQFAPEVIRDCFQQGIDVIICGHAHKPSKRSLSGRYLYTLPSWDTGNGGYLLYHDGMFAFHDISF